MKDIVTASARVVVMADKARDMLINVYGADPGKIDVIAHGIPDVPLASARAAKERLGFTDRKVILTFGLMSPNKGIETMIEAMPEIVRRSEEHTSELQSLMRISYAVFCLTKKNILKK